MHIPTIEEDYTYRMRRLMEKFVGQYEELQDLSLRFTLKPDTSKEYTPVSHLYNTSILNTYSDPRFIYNYTGY